jgi:hypothetical protein
MSMEQQREQIANIIAAIHEIGWTPDQVKAGTFHLNEVSGSNQFDRAAPGDETYADLAREAGLEP